MSQWRTRSLAARHPNGATTALLDAKSPWKKGAPFPEADEELYGVAVNGKLYVMGGWGDGKARGANYEYDPATDRWTKKQPMPRPAHHAALAAVNGKIYAFGGFVAPATTAIPLGAAWEPIADAYEFNPATDSWKPIAPLPGKRGSAIAAEVNGKIYVIGGATTMEGQGTVFTAFGPPVMGTNDCTTPHEQGESRKHVSGAAQHASAARHGRLRIGGRTGQASSVRHQNRFGRSVQTLNSWKYPRSGGPMRRVGGLG